MPDTSQGVSVGDAVLSFIGNTTQLDQSIDALPGKVEAGVARASGSLSGLQTSFDQTGDEAQKAGEEVSDAMEKSSESAGEARGAVALLGEEIGVHLPRHAQAFIAQLPGVGEALSSAFTAVAILAVLEAVVKLTEKVTDFVSTTYIYTTAMKDADAATASLNKSILDNEAEIAKLNAAYDQMTMSPLALLTKQLDEVNQKMVEQKEEVSAAQDELYAYRNGLDGVTEAQAKQAEGIITGSAKAMEVLVDQNRNLSTQIDHLYSDAANKAKETSEKNMATFNELMEQQKNYAGQLALEYQELVDSIEKIPTAASSAFSKLTLDAGDVRDAMTKGQQAAQGLGIELRTDLVQNLTVATRALQEFQASGIKDDTALQQFQQKVKDAAKELQDYGRITDEVTKGQQLATTASTDFGDSLASGFIKAASGAEGWGEAMTKATGQAISSLGQYCQVQAMACLAKALSEWWDGAAAGADMAAFAEYEAAALACGVAGAAISSSAGGGTGGGFQGTGRQNPNSQIQTTGGTSQSVSTTTNVQHFAAGGLISSPTLSVIGDSPSGPEAVLPLGDADAMSQIARAVTEHLGPMMNGHSITHQNTFFGKPSLSDLKKLSRAMNRAVAKGTASMSSTKTGRIVRRSP